MRHRIEFHAAVVTLSSSVIRCMLLGLLGIASLTCSRDAQPTGPPLPETTGIDQYPMAVGDEWKYAVYDSASQLVDTVLVRIALPTAGEKTFSRVWVYSGRSHNDSLYVEVTDNTFLIFDSPDADQPSSMIVFPLFTGASWGDAVDTNVVRLESTLTVPAGTFEGTFRIDRRVWGFNYGLDSHTWIKAGIGIVKIEMREYKFAPNVNEQWNLVGFRHAQ